MKKITKRTRMVQLREILKDPDRKPLTRMIYELFYLSLIYKELPFHYVTRYLFKKEATNIKNYLPNKLISRIPSYFNDKKVKEVLDNKLYFDLFYRQFGINLPKIIMYNHKNLFIIDNKTVIINSVHDFLSLLTEIFEKKESSDSIFIKKTYSSASGRNTIKLYKQEIISKTEIIHDIYSEVINSEFLFQESIKQHPVLDKISSSSLNTIRFDTFIDQEGKIEIISAFLKISTNNSHVDNVISGGCGIGIDFNTGRLKRYGYSKPKINGVKVFKEHPLTKVVFENISVPMFGEAKELVLNVASLMPNLRLVGWDVGIGESGPVLIEGNSDYGINSNDLAYGGYMTNPVFRKVLNEIGFLKAV
jgi:hypothetical protein